jgi:hypothetical protein
VGSIAKLILTIAGDSLSSEPSVRQFLLTSVDAVLASPAQAAIHV